MPTTSPDGAARHSGAGRPRDPSMEPRITLAACEAFGRVGWAGFTIDLVAQLAEVGKPTIYRRWASKADLLCDALMQHIRLAQVEDIGPVRDNLVALVSSMLELYTGPAGDAAVRMTFEGPKNPELHGVWMGLRAEQIAMARRVLDRGIADGSVRPSASPGILLEALMGGAMMHVMTHADRGDASTDRLNKHAGRLVDAIAGPHLTPTHS